MKSLIKILLVIFLLGVVPAVSMAGEGPIKGGGNFGAGLIVGGPGDWGAVGKIWIDHNSAFQPAVKLGGGTATLQMDYLWHEYSLIQMKEGLMPIYFGGGADLILQNVVLVGARGVVGLSYMFNRENVPVDIFLEVAPTLWFGSGASNFQMYGELGGRYYF